MKARRAGTRAKARHMPRKPCEEATDASLPAVTLGQLGTGPAGHTRGPLPRGRQPHGARPPCCRLMDCRDIPCATTAALYYTRHTHGGILCTYLLHICSSSGHAHDPLQIRTCAAIGVEDDRHVRVLGLDSSCHALSVWQAELGELGWGQMVCPRVKQLDHLRAHSRQAQRPAADTQCEQHMPGVEGGGTPTRLQHPNANCGVAYHRCWCTQSASSMTRAHT